MSFSFLLVTCFLGQVTIVPAWFPVPGHTTSSGGWICRKSVAFYYLAAIMSRNSAVFRREDSHSPSCPGMGGTALVLLRRPSSREAVKLTKLRNVHPVNKSLYLWNKHALSNYILGTLGDGCEMSASVEGRLPFLDHKLFEYAAQLPMQMKIKNYINEKYVLKEAARPYITDRIYRRQKHPFQAPPLTRYFSKSEYERIYDELTSDSLMGTGIYNRTAVTDLLVSLPSMSVLEQTAYEPVLMLMLTIYYMNQKLMN